MRTPMLILEGNAGLGKEEELQKIYIINMPLELSFDQLPLLSSKTVGNC